MLDLNGKTVLMIIAHPDDEIIFGWPIFQNKNINKKVLCCSNDLNNPERIWCKNRKLAFNEVCKFAGVKELRCLDYNSEFYRMATRNESLKEACQNMLSNAGKMGPFDFVFTHNHWGEYGHLDHILVNRLCMSLNNKVIMTDIFEESNWLPYTSTPNKDIKQIFSISTVEKMDRSFFNSCKEIYSRHGVWTWSKESKETCKIGVLE